MEESGGKFPPLFNNSVKESPKSETNKEKGNKEKREKESQKE